MVLPFFPYMDEFQDKKKAPPIEPETPKPKPKKKQEAEETPPEGSENNE